VAQRAVPLHSGVAGFGIDGWWQIAERAVRPDGVVVVLPDRQGFTRMGERSEERLVQQLVAQLAVEALDEGILLRLARFDVMPFDPCLLCVNAVSNFPKCAEVKFPSWRVAVISRLGCDQELHFWVADRGGAAVVPGLAS
jgi:hypothetical protein